MLLRAVTVSGGLGLRKTAYYMVSGLNTSERFQHGGDGGQSDLLRNSWSYSGEQP